MQTNTSRRALLKAAPVVAVTATIPAIALATVPADRRAWEGAMSAYQAAKAEDEAFDPIYWQIHRRWEAARPSMDMIDWREFFPERTTEQGRAHVARQMDIDARYQQFVEGHEKWWWSPDPEKRKRQYRSALDSVQAFRNAEAKNERDSGMADADERWEALGEAVGAARDTLMEAPAPDLAALRWKLEQLRDPDGDMAAWTSSFVGQTYADIARLLPEGA